MGKNRKKIPFPPKKTKNKNKNTRDIDVNFFPSSNSPLISMTSLKKIPKINTGFLFKKPQLQRVAQVRGCMTAIAFMLIIHSITH